MRVTYTGTTWAHVQHVGRTMRSADRVECTLATGLSPEQAIVASTIYSDEAMTAHVDGIPAAVFGYAQRDEFSAVPWLLGNELVTEVPKTLVRDSRQWAKRIHREFPDLLNWVHEDNTYSRRYLQAIGFEELTGPQPYGIYGGRFILFRKCATQ